jgi:hypothetical protein
MHAHTGEHVHIGRGKTHCSQTLNLAGGPPPAKCIRTWIRSQVQQNNTHIHTCTHEHCRRQTTLFYVPKSTGNSSASEMYAHTNIKSHTAMQYPYTNKHMPEETRHCFMSLNRPGRHQHAKRIYTWFPVWYIKFYCTRYRHISLCTLFRPRSVFASESKHDTEGPLAQGPHTLQTKCQAADLKTCGLLTSFQNLTVNIQKKDSAYEMYSHLNPNTIQKALWRARAYARSLSLSSNPMSGSRPHNVWSTDHHSRNLL